MSKTHDVDGNSFVANRKGANCVRRLTLVLVCSTNRVLLVQRMGVWCINAADAWTQVIEPHACPRTDFPASRPVVDGLRGKSKGFGKGNSKQKGRWQS